MGESAIVLSQTLPPGSGPRGLGLMERQRGSYKHNSLCWLVMGLLDSDSHVKRRLLRFACTNSGGCWCCYCSTRAVYAFFFFFFGRSISMANSPGTDLRLRKMMCLHARQCQSGDPTLDALGLQLFWKWFLQHLDPPSRLTTSIPTSTSSQK